MSEEEPITEPIISEPKIDGYWDQGLHTGTIRRIMREQYNCQFCDHIKRFQDEVDHKWYDMFYVPIKMEEIQERHRNRVLEEVCDEQGNFLGLHLVVRNYHFKPKETEPVENVEDRKIREAMRYQENRERRLAYARSQWNKNKENPEYREKRRTNAREYMREKNGYKGNSEE